MNSTISLQQYRALYPCAASVPTLTQQGLIGPMMVRIEEKSARILFRRERRRRIMMAILHPFGGESPSAVGASQPELQTPAKAGAANMGTGSI